MRNEWEKPYCCAGLFHFLYVLRINSGFSRGELLAVKRSTARSSVFHRRSDRWELFRSIVARVRI